METATVQVKSERAQRKLIGYSVNNGWQARSFSNTLNRFIETAPKNVPITDDEILSEIKQVRQNVA